jgi:NAD(P)-dependent dehydrogenase (short-subunit alcohol dehydrogenase family)
MGRGVLVTGSSRGIGAAIAAAFAAQGDRVAVHCSSGATRHRAEAVAAALPGSGHLVVVGDLADPDAVRHFVGRAHAGLGQIDVLVNNGAVFDAHPIADVGYEAWQQAWTTTIAVNLLGAANAAYCVARLMIADGVAGRIVNVSSRGAFRGEPDCPAYGASKAGLNAMGQSLALALAPHGIVVSAVAPGFVETDMAAEVLDSPRGDEVRAQSPFGRVGRPEEVADAVLYLASPQAEWASGAILDLNGASYLRS